MNVGSLYASLDLDTSMFTGGLKVADSSLRAFNSSVGNSVQSLTQMQNLLSGAALSTLAIAALKAGDQIIALDRRIAMLANTLRDLKQDNRDAGQIQSDIYGWITKTANQTGQSFTELAKTYTQLAPIAASYGIEQGKIRDTILGTIGAAKMMGASNDEMSRAFVAIRQVVGKNSLQMEELRQQLGEAMPLAFQMTAKGLNELNKKTGEFGVGVEITMSRLTNLIQNGKISGKQFLEAWGLAVAGAKEVATAAAYTIEGQWQVLKNTLGKGVGEFMVNSGAQDAAIGMFAELNTQVDGFLKDLDDNAGAYRQTIEDTVKTFVETITNTAEAIKPIVDTVVGVASGAFGELIGFYNSLSPEVREWGLVGAAIIGTKNMVGIAAIASMVNDIYSVGKDYLDPNKTFDEKDASTLTKGGMIGQAAFAARFAQTLGDHDTAYSIIYGTDKNGKKLSIDERMALNAQVRKQASLDVGNGFNDIGAYGDLAKLGYLPGMSGTESPADNAKLIREALQRNPATGGFLALRPDAIDNIPEAKGLRDQRDSLQAQLDDLQKKQFTGQAGADLAGGGGPQGVAWRAQRDDLRKQIADTQTQLQELGKRTLANAYQNLPKTRSPEDASRLYDYTSSIDTFLKDQPKTDKVIPVGLDPQSEALAKQIAAMPDAASRSIARMQQSEAVRKRVDELTSTGLEPQKDEKPGNRNFQNNASQLLSLQEKYMENLAAGPAGLADAKINSRLGQLMRLDSQGAFDQDVVPGLAGKGQDVRDAAIVGELKDLATKRFAGASGEDIDADAKARQALFDKYAKQLTNPELVRQLQKAMTDTAAEATAAKGRLERKDESTEGRSINNLVKSYEALAEMRAKAAAAFVELQTNPGLFRAKAAQEQFLIKQGKLQPDAAVYSATGASQDGGQGLIELGVQSQLADLVRKRSADEYNVKILLDAQVQAEMRSSAILDARNKATQDRLATEQQIAALQDPGVQQKQLEAEIAKLNLSKEQANVAAGRFGDPGYRDATYQNDLAQSNLDFAKTYYEYSLDAEQRLQLSRADGLRGLADQFKQTTTEIITAQKPIGQAFIDMIGSMASKITDLFATWTSQWAAKKVWDFADPMGTLDSLFGLGDGTDTAGSKDQVINAANVTLHAANLDLADATGSDGLKGLVDAITTPASTSNDKSADDALNTLAEGMKTGNYAKVDPLTGGTGLPSLNGGAGQDLLIATNGITQALTSFGGVMGQFVNGLGSVLGGLVSGGSLGGGKGAGGLVSSGLDWLGNLSLFHTGGMPSFLDLPKYHDGGLLPGEIPLIAKQGEGIFTPKQMDNADQLMRAAMTSGGKDGGMSMGDVNVTVNASGGTTGQNADLARQVGNSVKEQLRGMIQNEVRQMSRPGGMLGVGA